MSNLKPSWDEYFLRIADVVSIRSPDPIYKVGAVVVSSDNRIIGTGYNGFIPGFNEAMIDWNDRNSIRPYIIHAEMNAIIYSKKSLDWCKLYVTLSPCDQCIKLIAASGIKTIIYRDVYKDLNFVRSFCINNNIRLVQHI